MESTDTINLAANMDEEALRASAREAVEGFEADDDSRKDWLDKHAHWRDLYFQQDKPLNAPFDGASEESLPLLAEACNQFHARAYPALFPHARVFKALPSGKVDEEASKRAERVTTHLNWQLLSGDDRAVKGYKRNKDALLAALPLDGSFFTKTYYDPVWRRLRVENVRAEDLVVPYGIGPRAIEDLERMTHIIWMPMVRAKMLAAVGYFTEEPQPWRGFDATETQQAQEDAEGITPDAVREHGFAKILEQHCWQDLDGDGLPEPYIVTVDGTSKKVLRITERYEVDANSGLRIATEYFTHYVCIPNPNGFYGLGFGHLIGNMNTSVNKLLRMTTDAAELQNVGNSSGFIDSQLEVPGTEVGFELGKFAKVRANGQDLRQGVYKFDFPGPAPALEKVMAVIMARSDRLATVTEALTGQTEAVMQPTALMALIEQGLTQFTTIIMRQADAIGDELAKIARCNRLHLPPEQYFAVLDIDGRAAATTIARADYEADMQIRLTIDPKNITDTQRLAKAQALYQFATTNPLVLQNPVALYNASMRYLEALGIERPAEILPPVHLQTPQPLQIDDPNQENMLFLMPAGPVPTVMPMQDHATHILAHDMLLNDPAYGPHIPPDRLAALMQHKQQHVMFMYGQTEMPMMGGGMDAGGFGAGPGIVDPLAAQRGFPMATDAALAQAAGSVVPLGGGTGLGGPAPVAGGGPGAEPDAGAGFQP